MTSFGTIRNNTALKQMHVRGALVHGFGTIRNNTALKLGSFNSAGFPRFGTIRNNTALKRRGLDDLPSVVLEPFETTQL